MGDRPEAFLRVFRTDDELSEEVEDEFL
jgi:hypothetical protein